SAGYRWRKFARRNKRGLATAAVAALAILTTSAALGWAVRDREARAVEAAKERAARQAKLEDQVTRALMEARNWLDRERLPEAIASVGRAETLLAAGESDAKLHAVVQQAREGVD